MAIREIRVVGDDILTKKCKECMFCYDINNCDFENMNDENLNRYYSIMKERLSK